MPRVAIVHFDATKRMREIKHFGSITHRYRNVPSLAEPDRPGCGWRQIDMPAAHKGATIVDTYGDAPIVTDPKKCAER
jgi:hypothetical protein